MKHRLSFPGIFLLLFLIVGCCPQNSPEVTKKMSLQISKATAGSLLVCNSGEVAKITANYSGRSIWVRCSPKSDVRELSIECAAQRANRVVPTSDSDYGKFLAQFNAADDW